MKIYLLSFLFVFCACSNKQDLSSSTLLNNSIAYHDPNNSWSSFNSSFSIRMSMPDKVDRLSNISINLPKDYFGLQIEMNSVLIDYKIRADSCSIALNGSNTYTKEDLDTYNINCDRGKMYKDYYTFLYGLPMKLKDPGTLVDDSVERRTLIDEEYLVLRATYDPTVGSDIWYFYFNPDTYALEAYQFFKSDENGKEIKESGEFILLSGTKKINDILIPKVRDWYYNKDQSYLATDVLE